MSKLATAPAAGHTAGVRAVTALSFAFSCHIAQTAQADPLADAQRAYAEVNYPRCRDDAERSLQGAGDRGARATAYRYLGLCQAALNDLDGAREAFRRMLAIDKDARLPEGLSPRFTSSYREARGSLVTAVPLALIVEQETIDGGTRSVRLKVVDELALVQQIGWRGAAGSTGGPVRTASLLELELPAEVDVTVFALDAAGGTIAELALPAHKSKPALAPSQTPTTQEDFPWLVVGATAVAVVALSAAGVGVALALLPPAAVTLKTDVVFGD